MSRALNSVGNKETSMSDLIPSDLSVYVSSTPTDSSGADAGAVRSDGSPHSPNIGRVTRSKKCLEIWRRNSYLTT